ncbi:glycosyltransferase family 1 protein [Microbacterium paludicola]|uniref:rhamnosyltransferase WsaF family glycosyltransferase n=1 Tax=Microbacterium paludicola TaxID=300019 RepID=UPI00119D91D9|nr:glycosyltransferase family 1 protein [Microbacterium paludicola]
MTSSPKRGILARLRRRSPAYLLRYAALRLYEKTGAAQLLFPVLDRDLADSSRLRPFRTRAVTPGSRPSVAWVIHPPTPGSGGHTTLFRMVRAAADAGFACTLLLYDLHHGDHRYYHDVIRHAWPSLSDVGIAMVGERISGYDAVVASSWSTAHVIASRAVEGKRLYFIQDYEPFFTPRGSEYAYAEDSYRLGFRHLALGEMVQGLLRDELGVASDLIPFGLDTRTYRLLPSTTERRGVCWYAKKGSDRRGYRHAVRALQLFHEEHPDEPIHVYGDAVSGLPFPVTHHGVLSAAQLNELYNTVVAGLALSFTNVSLVPEELLAAGAIPVVNEDPHARMVLRAPGVVWAAATPAALADALGSVVAHSDRDARAAAAARSVSGRSWDPAEEAVVEVLRDELGIA